MSVEHQIAQPNSCSQGKQLPFEGPSAGHLAKSFVSASHLCWRADLGGHHVRGITAFDRAICQGCEPAQRVERNESLDEREASATIDDVMAVRNFAVC